MLQRHCRKRPSVAGRTQPRRFLTDVLEILNTAHSRYIGIPMAAWAGIKFIRLEWGRQTQTTALQNSSCSKLLFCRCVGCRGSHWNFGTARSPAFLFGPKCASGHQSRTSGYVRCIWRHASDTEESLAQWLLSLSGPAICHGARSPLLALFSMLRRKRGIVQYRMQPRGK
jgi:hypothetical protein